MTITAGAMAGGYFLSQHANQDSDETQVASSTSTAATNSQGALQVAGTASTGQVLSGNDSAPSGSSAPSTSVPGPETFREYEQYATRTDTLFSDIQIGTGDEAATGDVVLVAYKGWLTDGTLFDQSKVTADGKREGFSVKLGAGSVIKGWDQGIVGMKVGGIRRLIIPPSLAYGEAGRDPVPPNALLVFDVELAQVQKSPKAGESGL